MAKSKNIFVLDTCVLLHDPNCIYKFEEHDLYIPLACIDDLDEIKTRKDSTGWAAREVFRNLDKYDILQITKGVVVNEFGGKLYLYNNEAPLQRGEKPAIVRVNSDNAIIDAAMSLKAENAKRKVIIVSKDTGLRVRAVSWGCLAENYRNDLLGDDKTFEGYRTVDVIALEDWEYLNQRKTCDINKLSCKDGLQNLNPNEFICFKFGNQSVFAWYKNREIIFLDEKKKKEAYMGVVAKNMEQRFALEALSDDNIPLVCLNGKAGSGKTLCAIAVGLEKVKNGQYDRIIVMKPLIAVGGKDIGFLPGSKFEKVSAWLGPFKDNIIQLTSFNDYDKGGKFGGNNFEEMVEDGTIEVEAMAFIQGRSIPNSYIILDECLVADSLIYTGNGKLIKIQDIVDGEYVNSWNTSSNIFENNQISNKFSRTSDTIIRLSTSRGVIECSPTHKMWVYENGSSLIKKEVSKINLDDLIPCVTETEHYVENDLSDSEAALLAMILTDGHITKNSDAIKIDMSKDQEWLKESFLYAVNGNFSKFNIDNKTNARGNMIGRINNPSEIKRFISKHNLTCGKKAHKIEVPDMIWNAPISSVKKFIQLCFDYEGDVHVQERSNNVPQCVVNFVTCSKVFAYQMQGLLLKFGIESHIYNSSPKNKPEHHNSCYKVSIVGGYMCKKYGQTIGFSMQRKQKQLEYIYDFEYSCPYVYPKVVALDLYNSLEDNGRWKDKNNYYKSNMNDDLNGNRINHNDGPGISHNTLQKVQIIADKLNYSLKNVVACSKINSITLFEEPAEVFDFEVANNHTFIVNGLVSSNCENVSPKEARMVIERCGKNSKVVLLGDMSQIENPYLDKQSCGLAHAINGGKTHEVAASVTLQKVERSALSAAASQIFNVQK